MTAKISSTIFHPRSPKCLVFALVLSASSFLFATLSHGQTRPPAIQDDFDQPLKKEIKKLGPSPYYPNGSYQKTLSCFFYPTILVKQYDEGQKGAEWLSFVRLETEHPKRCELSHDSDERVIDWNGYFKGVKSNLVFFDAPDGLDQSIFFAVYDANTGKKLFEDPAYFSRSGDREVSPDLFDNLRIHVRADGQVTLRYRRVEATECDLHLEPDKCWRAVRAQLDLKVTKAPVCTEYAKIKVWFPSSIAYPVETTLFPKPVTKTIPGAVKCRPVD